MLVREHAGTCWCGNLFMLVRESVPAPWTTRFAGWESRGRTCGKGFPHEHDARTSGRELGGRVQAGGAKPRRSFVVEGMRRTP